MSTLPSWCKKFFRVEKDNNELECYTSKHKKVSFIPYDVCCSLVTFVVGFILSLFTVLKYQYYYFLWEVVMRKWKVSTNEEVYLETADQ